MNSQDLNINEISSDHIIKDQTTTIESYSCKENSDIDDFQMNEYKDNICERHYNESKKNLLAENDEIKNLELVQEKVEFPCQLNDKDIIEDNTDSHSKIINLEAVDDSKMETDKVTVANPIHSLNNSRINWLSSPTLLCKAENTFTKVKNNYLRGCFWSPDGTCILTNSNDNILRVFELPQSAYEKNASNNEPKNTELVPVLQMAELDLIYDFCWYPFMNSNNPDTCLLASTSRKNAVRLWDAYTGKERARIQPRDHMDEPTSAHSIAFSRCGFKMYCGFDKCVRVYDITRIGDTAERRPRLGNKSQLRGIISCISTSPVNVGLYACGSYNKDAAIFHENTGEEVVEFLRADDRVGGITHIEFSPVDMNVVVTGSRIDNALHVWDLRNPGVPLYATAKRNVQTNQRIFFSFDPSGNYIMTGDHDGKVSVFTINGGHIVVDDECVLPKIAEWSAHSDVCNGLSLHPCLPILATCSGQRRIVPAWRRRGMLNFSNDAQNSEDDSDDWSTDEEIDTMFGADENQLKVWSYPIISTESLYVQ